MGELGRRVAHRPVVVDAVEDVRADLRLLAQRPVDHQVVENGLDEVVRADTVYVRPEDLTGLELDDAGGAPLGVFLAFQQVQPPLEAVTGTEEAGL